VGAGAGAGAGTGAAKIRGIFDLRGDFRSPDLKDPMIFPAPAPAPEPEPE
jgi:hypothetical protein